VVAPSITQAQQANVQLEVPSRGLYSALRDVRRSGVLAVPGECFHRRIR
jgi:hypothetical protein